MFGGIAHNIGPLIFAVLKIVWVVQIVSVIDKEDTGELLIISNEVV